MLKGIDPILTPLLWLMASMGMATIWRWSMPTIRPNGSPALVTGRLIRLPGLLLPQVISAILGLLPLDASEPDPIRP